jgi:hypothetical protein
MPYINLKTEINVLDQVCMKNWVIYFYGGLLISGFNISSKTKVSGYNIPISCPVLFKKRLNRFRGGGGLLWWKREKKVPHQEWNPGCTIHSQTKDMKN